MKQIRMNRILKAAFSSLEVVDATENLLLFPTKEDFEDGVRGDPLHCGFANCAARICGATQAHFFARFVYIDHPGKDGVRRAYRYVVSDPVGKAIAAYDEGEAIKTGRVFLLRAPSPSMTLKAQRAYAKEWSQSAIAKAIAKEKETRRALRMAEVDLERVQELKERGATPAKARELDRRSSVARAQFLKLREQLVTVTKRVKDIRSPTSRTGKAKPQKHNIRVRSGKGAFIKELSMRRKGR